MFEEGVLFEDGVLSLSGIIHGWDVSAAAVQTALRGVSGPITVAINSGGGDATEGVAIYNALRRYAENKGPVTCEVDGLAASAASMIFLAGDTRLMRAGTLLMVHEPWAFAAGGGDDLRKTADVLDKHTDAYAALYAERTGGSDEEVRSLMREETWMSPGDAAEKGFASDTTEEIASDPPTFAYGLYQHTPAELQRVAVSEPELMAAIERKQQAMTITKTAAKTAATKDINAQVVDDGRADADASEAKAELARRDAITSLGVRASLDVADVQEMISKGLSVEEAQASVIDKLADRQAAQQDPDDQGHAPAAMSVIVGEEQSEKFAQAVVDGQLARYRIGEDANAKANEFTGCGVSDLARAVLSQSGHKVPTGSRAAISNAITTARADAGIRHNSGDFPSILENIAEKASLTAYEQVPETYTDWAKIGTLSDFKSSARAGVDPFPNLDPISGNGEIKMGTFGDRGEKINLGSFGRRVGLTFEMLVNDDLGEFLDLMASAGRAGRRLEGDLAYDVLTNNESMSDGHALFSAQHNNLATGANAGAPSVDTLGKMRAMLRKQKLGDATLNLRGRQIVVPSALESVAMQLMASEYDPAKETRAANIFRGTMGITVDARLDENSATEWYIFADPTTAPAVEVAFLAGQEQPIVDTKDGWSVDGVELRVRHYVGAGAIDFRGASKNNG